MRLLNISDTLINLKNKLKLKNAVSIAAAVMLGVTSLAGCGFVSNPVEYMSQADYENGTTIVMVITRPVVRERLVLLGHMEV